MSVLAQLYTDMTEEYQCLENSQSFRSMRKCKIKLLYHIQLKSKALIKKALIKGSKAACLFKLFSLDWGGRCWISFKSGYKENSKESKQLRTDTSRCSVFAKKITSFCQSVPRIKLLLYFKYIKVKKLWEVFKKWKWRT